MSGLPPPTAPAPPPPPSLYAPPFPGPDAPPRPAEPGMATASLVCGIVGLVGFFIAIPSTVALVLGLIAWTRARAAPGPGSRRGQALAGWILGLIGVLGFLALVIAAIVADAYDDESTSINEVRVGQCVDIGLDGAALTSVERRDCDEPHDAEVYLVRRIDGFAEFPGERELDRRGVATCDETALERYAGSSSGDGTLSPWYVVPSKATWPAGDRTIVCLVTSVDDRKLTGSVEDQPD